MRLKEPTEDNVSLEKCINQTGELISPLYKQDYISKIGIILKFILFKKELTFVKAEPEVSEIKDFKIQ